MGVSRNGWYRISSPDVVPIVWQRGKFYTWRLEKPEGAGRFSREYWKLRIVQDGPTGEIAVDVPFDFRSFSEARLYVRGYEDGVFHATKSNHDSQPEGQGTAEPAEVPRHSAGD